MYLWSARDPGTLILDSDRIAIGAHTRVFGLINVCIPRVSPISSPTILHVECAICESTHEDHPMIDLWIGEGQVALAIESCGEVYGNPNH